MRECPAPLILERLLLGDPDACGVSTWSEHIGGCPRCQLVLDGLRRDDETFRASAANREVLERLRIAQGVGRATARRWWPQVLWPAALAAGLAGAFLWRQTPSDPWASKGSAGILGVDRTRLGVASHWAGERLAVGDRLQLTWLAQKDGALAVMGIDGAGIPTVLFPPGGGTSVKVVAGTTLELGGSILVTPELEGGRLCALFSEEVFLIGVRVADECARGGPRVKVRYSLSVSREDVPR